MALDIGLESIAGTNDPLDRKLVVSLEEGEMAFFSTAIEALYLQTGVAIDQYENARLDGLQLSLFEKMLKEKIDEVKRKPNQWEEFSGYQQLKDKTGKNKIQKWYVTLFKSDFLKKLNDLQQLTREAQDKQRVLFFFGD